MWPTLYHILVVAVITLFIQPGCCWTTRFGRISTGLAALKSEDDGLNDIPVLLPIFPLRKSVRFPTDTITLNLYETRYLQLAEHVFQNPVRGSLLFGALYTADKCQVVTDNGMGAVVPVLSTNDVGTIFEVVKDEEGEIPTRGGELRRRIRLEAIGVSRFRIEAIVKPGFSLDGTQSDNNDTPYIMANVSYIKDEPMAQEENDRIQNFLNELLDLNPETATKSLDLPKSNESGDEGQATTTVASALALESKMDPEELSFTVASKIMERSASAERARVLKMTSLSERAEYLKTLGQRPKQWWSFWS